MKKTFYCLSIIFLLFSSCTGKETDLSKVTSVAFAGSSVNVEIADSDNERSVGLMFRESMASNAGMLFVFDQPTRPAFYMKNTAIPLDIIFINRDLSVVTIKQMTPFDEKTLHRPTADATFALEVNKGWAEKHGVKEGDKATFIIPKGK